MSDRARFVGPLERVLYLKTVPALQGLGHGELGVVARQSRERSFRRGARLFHEGSPLRSFHLIVEGSVRMERNGQLFERRGPRDHVGFLHALAGDLEGADAIAEENTITLELGLEAILGVFEDHFPLLQSAIVNLAGRMQELLIETSDGQYKAPWGDAIVVPSRGLDLVERLVLIRRTETFRNVGMQTLANMTAGMKQVRVPAATPLWRPGDPADHLLLIVSGQVRCRQEDDRAFRCGPGYPLGNVETLARSRRWYEATTETELLALRGDHERLFDAFEDNFEMAMDFLAAMARGILGALLHQSRGGRSPTA